MLTTITSHELRKAVELARHAPSIHNTQPWLWTVAPAALRLWLDPDRVLKATDPGAHGAVVSCGGALLLAKLALASSGWQTAVDYETDQAEPALLATLRVTGRRYAMPHDGSLTAIARSGVSDRRFLDANGISAAQLEGLCQLSSERDAFVDLVRPTDEDKYIWLTVLTSRVIADAEADPAQVAELRRWVRHDGSADDGTPQWAVPETVDGPQRGKMPHRGVAAPGHPGVPPVPGGFGEPPVFAVVMTPHDTRQDHVRAGEVMMRLILEAWLANLASCPVSQVVDRVSGRFRLGQALGGIAIPQMMLRLGTPLGCGVLSPTQHGAVDSTIDE